MHFFYKRYQQFVVIVVLLVSLSACLVGPDFERPQAPTRFNESPWLQRTTGSFGTAGVSQYFVHTKHPIVFDWWRCFRSEKIDALVMLGLRHSPNLAKAEAVLKEAQETLNAKKGGWFPAFSAQLAAQRGTSLTTGSAATGSAAAATTSSVVNTALPTVSIFNLFNASVNVSYMLDFFGGLRREIESLQKQVDYQYFQRGAAVLSLVGNIVTTTIAMASLESQLAVTQQLVAEQKEQLMILKQQLRLGGASLSEVWTQQNQVAQTQATLPPLEKSLAQTRHTLAVLVGDFPDAMTIPHMKLSELQLPSRLPLSVPSSLVRQRPDVCAAEALWAAANAQVGVATARLYPQFTITTSYGRLSSMSQHFFSPSNQLWNLGSALLQPLFSGGSLQAQRRAAIAAYDQAKFQYQQVVLQAFENVADTLRALQADARELKAQQQAESTAAANLNLTQQQFRLGGVSYLALLEAQRQYQRSRIGLLQAQASRFVDTAALFQALGGGVAT